MSFSAVEGRFARAVELGFEVLRRGGTAGAVLNSANEAAVEAFLDRRIGFGQIVPIVEDVLNRASDSDEITLEAMLRADRWARLQVQRAVTEAIGSATQ